METAAQISAKYDQEQTQHYSGFKQKKTRIGAFQANLTHTLRP